MPADQRKDQQQVLWTERQEQFGREARDLREKQEREELLAQELWTRARGERREREQHALQEYQRRQERQEQQAREQREREREQERERTQELRKQISRELTELAEQLEREQRERERMEQEQMEWDLQELREREQRERERELLERELQELREQREQEQREARKLKNRFKQLLPLAKERLSVVHTRFQRNSIERPPGSTLLIVADFFFSEKYVKGTFRPLVADLQQEYCEALNEGRIWKSHWIRVRYACYFAKAFGLTKVLSWVPSLIKKLGGGG